MPKKNRSKRMRGGWPWDSSSEGLGSSSGTGWFADLKKKASSATGSTSSWFTTSTPAPTAVTPAPTAVTPIATPAPITGGRKRKSHRMRGGYSDNVSLTNLASRAAPFSGETARAQAYVGGKRTRRRRHKKSHRRYRHK